MTYKPLIYTKYYEHLAENKKQKKKPIAKCVKNTKRNLKTQWSISII